MAGEENLTRSVLPEQQPDALVLVVHEQSHILDPALKELERHGHTTVIARDGASCLHQIRQHRPDLLLLNFRLPDTDGVTLLKQIRSNPGFESIPAIFLASTEDIAHLFSGNELMGVDYITEPYNPFEMLVRVENNLRLHRLEKDSRVRLTEEVRRRTYETLLITISHYINNAVGSIEMGLEMTPSDDPMEVSKFKEMVRRQSRVISSTILAIKEMKEQIEHGTINYIEGRASMLDIEGKIKQQLEDLRRRDREDEGS